MNFLWAQSPVETLKQSLLMYFLTNNDGNRRQENSLIFMILLAKTLFNIQNCRGFNKYCI